MRTVVTCGSARFEKEIRVFEERLRELGVNVFTPHLTHFNWDLVPDEYAPYIARGLTHDHFYKIRMADAVFIYNKDGYAGPSVTLEIGYAAACNKPIYALTMMDPELCRGMLFHKVARTPEDLVAYLT
ncbi:MAG: hypothetical protein HY566_03580 [Candidatus Kerfeldbacteria bacterium]|nr:hypothetical protein [Candidatus Kerfeldbacteria bacterium]